MRKKLLYSAIIVFILLKGASSLMIDLNMPNVTILKTAIKKGKLSGKRYILCKEAWVTGFNWILIRNEMGIRTKKYCNIIGPNPFDDFALKYEFRLGKNTFIFYVEEKNTYYSEELGQNVTEYVATGWDILYPVQHDEYFYEFWNKSRFITEDDVEKETN